MATAIKKCRVCGKPYEACHTIRRVAGVFRWQEVACSPECGSIYLARIEESRNAKPVEVKDENAVEETKVVVGLIEDDEDEDETTSFDDEDEFDNSYDNEDDIK